MAKAAGIVTGLGALMLLAMCQKSPAPVTAAAIADPSPAVQPIALDDDRATVTAARADCRAQPAAKAPVVVRLVRGARLEVLERRDPWVKVSPTGEACWVAVSQINGASSSDGAPAALYAPRANDRPTTVRPRSSTPISRPRRSTGLYGAGSCPCGSGNICIGPRGGRYCITSGGNKRYGM
jgi:hypothetical protein